MKRHSIGKKIVNMSVLLDVLMIMIFYYMISCKVQMNQQEEHAKANTSYYEQQLDKVTAENEKLKDTLQCKIYTVTISLLFYEDKHRSIEIAQSNQETPEVFTFDDTTKDDTISSVYTFLSTLMEQSQDAFHLQLCYNGDTVYSKDVRAILAMISQLRNESDKYVEYTELEMSKYATTNTLE